VVSLAQPKRGVIRWLLGQTYYPDNSYTRTPEGDPIRPYDMSADVLAEFMGVRVDPVSTSVEVPLSVLTDWVNPIGTVSRGQQGYLVSGLQNDAFKAANLLFETGASMRRVNIDAGRARAGDFIVDSEVAASTVSEVAKETGVDFMALNVDLADFSHPIERQRIGMYQRYYGGNMDEGWTRWLLEDFEFEYSSLLDPDILEGNLADKWDVIILPADSKEMMLGPSGSNEGRGPDPSSTPPDYRSGFGQEGIEALEAFVQAGGTLVTFAEAGDLAIDEFGLPVRNAVSGMSGNEFWSPGSTLKVDVDTSSPFAHGMPERALAIYLANGQVYETVPGARSSDVRRVLTYIDRDILQSGWLLGEEVIANKAAVVSVQHGQGMVLLIGFRAQHRAQTHGTFKLLFNALMGHS